MSCDTEIAEKYIPINIKYDDSQTTVMATTPKGGYGTETNSTAWFEIKSITIPYAEKVKYSFRVLLLLIPLDIVQKAIPKKIPPAALLNENAKVRSIPKNIGSDCRRDKKTFRDKLRNWLRK